MNEIDSDSGDDIDPKAVAMIPQHIRDAAYLSTFLSSSTDDSGEYTIMYCSFCNVMMSNMPPLLVSMLKML